MLTSVLARFALVGIGGGLGSMLRVTHLRDARLRARGMAKLDGKVVVVTGASRGIGADIARLFAEEGGHVVCAARTLREGERLYVGGQG